MLGIAHTLVSEGRHDRAFLARLCVGWEVFEDYLLGRTDNRPKDAAWAAPICELAAEDIVSLARRAAGKRTLVTCSQSLQRARYGEQPVWMGLVLAAILGQVGLPGGGFAYALGSIAHSGKPQVAVPVPTLAQGRNSIADFIPVARISDMLLQPGAPFDYDGRRLAYPDIKLVYWVGGNPFHHHQDLHRLRDAFARPDTIIVHESAWTATARHADIVLPATITLEREDIGASPVDPLLVAMHQVVSPFGEAQDDYAIFSGLARRLGAEQAFTEGRSARQWLEHLYEPTRRALIEHGAEAPDFEEFWRRGELRLPTRLWDGGMVRAFRNDPKREPLPTPSGKIEIASAAIASFGYADCPQHPTWLPTDDDSGERFPLYLIANQPATRLHSQLDFGATSAASKVRDREPVRIHPHDAAARGIRDGDIVRLYNDRGACLAGAVLSDALRPGVVQLATGAWFDPLFDPDRPEAEKPLCVHGNPNVLTRDIGTSRLAQGSTGQIARIQIERFDGPLPPVRAFDPPADASGDV
jgi:biotin/methionine sulfoxide reductase